MGISCSNDNAHDDIIKQPSYLQHEKINKSFVQDTNIFNKVKNIDNCQTYFKPFTPSESPLQSNSLKYIIPHY